jgi:hypothetical protein
MLGEAMAAVTAAVAAAAVTAASMPQRLTLGVDTVTHVRCAAMLTVDTHVLVFAAGAGTRAMQDVHITGIAAFTGAAVDTGEVVIGEVAIGIRTMDIPGLVITATDIHTTAITVPHIIIPTDTTPISTDTGPTRA